MLPDLPSEASCEPLSHTGHRAACGLGCISEERWELLWRATWLWISNNQVPKESRHILQDKNERVNNLESGNHRSLDLHYCDSLDRPVCNCLISPAKLPRSPSHFVQNIFLHKKRNLSDEVRQLHLSMGTDANFKGSVILCPFSKNNSSRFTPGACNLPKQVWSGP